MITVSSAALVDNVIKSIKVQFKLKDLGSLNYFLGMKVTFIDDYLLLNQKKYVQELIAKVGLTEMSCFLTPMSGTCLICTGMDTSTKVFHAANLYRSTICTSTHLCNDTEHSLCCPQVESIYANT